MVNEGPFMIGPCAQLGVASARLNVAPMKPIARVFMLVILPVK
jgi:hypothetical protein